jgi:hypothetical protein
MARPCPRCGRMFCGPATGPVACSTCLSAVRGDTATRTDLVAGTPPAETPAS